MFYISLQQSHGVKVSQEIIGLFHIGVAIRPFDTASCVYVITKMATVKYFDSNFENTTRKTRQKEIASLQRACHDSL